MTTQENIQIAESLGIKRSMFHDRVDGYHDVVNIISTLHKKVHEAEIILETADHVILAFSKIIIHINDHGMIPAEHVSKIQKLSEEAMSKFDSYQSLKNNQ